MTITTPLLTQKDIAQTIKTSWGQYPNFLDSFGPFGTVACRMADKLESEFATFDRASFLLQCKPDAVLLNEAAEASDAKDAVDAALTFINNPDE